MKEFLLSDESLNSHGFIVRTKGINMERFRRNPVMFVNHQRDKGVAGRWENLRIQGNKVYGTPVFDDAHEPGKTAREQVEAGFMNGASIGVRNVRMEFVNGVETVVECELFEVSVCDIPSNKNTIQLYYQDKGVDLTTYKQLSLSNRTMEQDFQLVLQALSLPKDATMTDVLSSVNLLVRNHGKTPQIELTLAVEDGIITDEESRELLNLCDGNPGKLEKYLQRKRVDYELQVEKEYEELLNETRLRFDPVMYWDGSLKRLAMKDFKSFKRMLLSGITEPVINEDRNMDTSQGLRTLDDYRKHAPHLLKDNPTLYRRLIEKEEQAQKSYSPRGKYNY